MEPAISNQRKKRNPHTYGKGLWKQLWESLTIAVIPVSLGFSTPFAIGAYIQSAEGDTASMLVLAAMGSAVAIGGPAGVYLMYRWRG